MFNFLELFENEDFEAIFETASTRTPQTDLEERYSKHQQIPVIKEHFIEYQLPEALAAKDIDIEFGLHICAHIAVMKRARIDALVGIGLNKVPEVDMSPAQWAAAEIYKMLHAGFLNYDPEFDNIYVEYEPTQQLQEMIKQYRFPLPMIEEPMEVKHNRQTGYQTIKGSLILKPGNHHDGDICLDHINRMNRVPLSICTDTLAFVQHRWKSLDKRKSDETVDEFNKRRAQFLRYKGATQKVIDILLSYTDTVWLTHAYDKRGRTYCRGYHFTYQGADYNKACVQFAKEELLNDE